MPRERLDAAADRAIALSARFPVADPWPAEIRNKLMYVLVRLERWHEALTEAHRIGPYATSFPWGRLAEDPLACFLRVRADLRARAEASGHPQSERGGRSRSGDH